MIYCMHYITFACLWTRFFQYQTLHFASLKLWRLYLLSLSLSSPIPIPIPLSLFFSYQDVRKQEWTAIIPNSQLIVIPHPHNKPRRYKHSHSHSHSQTGSHTHTVTWSHIHTSAFTHPHVLPMFPLFSVSYPYPQECQQMVNHPAPPSVWPANTYSHRHTHTVTVPSSCIYQASTAKCIKVYTYSLNTHICH